MHQESGHYVDHASQPGSFQGLFRMDLATSICITCNGESFKLIEYFHLLVFTPSNRFNFESCDLIWKTVIGSCMWSNLSHGNSSHEKIFKRLSFHVILCVTRCDFLPSYRRKMTHHIITSDGIFQCLTKSMHCKKCSYFRLVTTVSEGWTMWPEKLCNRALVVAYCRPQMRESMRNKNACFVF